jgi:hypothetical protein
VKPTVVHIARKTAGKPTPALQITGLDPVPDSNKKDWESHYRQLYDVDALAIVNALHASLPGGTWDRVVCEMLRIQASLFAIASPSHLSS